MALCINQTKTFGSLRGKPRDKSKKMPYLCKVKNLSGKVVLMCKDAGLAVKDYDDLELVSEYLSKSDIKSLTRGEFAIV